MEGLGLKWYSWMNLQEDKAATMVILNLVAMLMFVSNTWLCVIFSSFLNYVLLARLLLSGIYNAWVQKSLDRLAVTMPGRYAKTETSEGFLGSIDVYAYRMPIAPPPLAEGAIDGETAPDAAAVIAGETAGDAN